MFAFKPSAVSRAQRLCASVFVLAVAIVAGAAASAEPVIPIWPGAAPGSEHWNWKEQVFPDVVAGYKHMGTVIENIVTPTPSVYLPERDKASGTGIIVAPGGACIGLAIDIEGRDVARWLQGKGIAAFVLKYRLQHKLTQGMPKNLNEDEACRWGIADAVQALKVLRAHAQEWKLSPDRIGMIGFSAGGMLASEAMVQKDAALRPDFVALIYGAPFATMPAIPRKLPADHKPAQAALPPIFMAWAQDDRTAGHAMMRFYRSLKAEGYAPEAHIYHAGGHGFASYTQGTTSDHWRDEFFWWLQAEGFTGPAR